MLNNKKWWCWMFLPYTWILNIMLVIGLSDLMIANFSVEYDIELILYNYPFQVEKIVYTFMCNYY